MHFLGSFSLVVTLCVLPIVSGLTATEATESLKTFTNQIYLSKTQLDAMRNPGIIETILKGINPESVPKIIFDVQQGMTVVNTTFENPESGTFAKDDGSKVYETTLNVTVAFHEFFTTLIDIYKYEYARIRDDIPEIRNRLIDLGPDDNSGRAIHSVFNRIGFWMKSDTETALEENVRPLIHYHIPRCISYYALEPEA